MKENDQRQRGKATILLGVGDGAVITEDEFIKKVEAKKKAQEKKRRKKVGKWRGRRRSY